MRNHKKLLATALAGILLFAQSTATFAAYEGGFDANVDSKSAVLQVVVPSHIEILIDQYEIGREGVQINSEPFSMYNHSQMPVQLSVTSTVSLASDITLADSKADAVESEGNDAWLAVAAATEEGSGGDSERVYGDGIATMDDADPTVDTFKSNGTVTQNFYLDKASGDIKYQAMIPDEDSIPYDGTRISEYYALTNASITEQAALDAALETGKLAVYDTTAGVLASKSELTILEKGTTATYDSNYTYYTVASKPTAEADLTANQTYAFGYTEDAGPSAQFQYLGRLSDSKETWSDEDITGLHISYKLTGITSTNYNKVADDLICGYLNEKTTEENTASVPTIFTSYTTYVTSDPNIVIIKYTLGGDDELADGITSIWAVSSGTTTVDILADDSLKTMVDITDTTITLSEDFLDLYANAGCSNIKLYICFDNQEQATPQVEISLVETIPASISTVSATYSKTTPSDIEIDYTLGVGSAKANGITNIWIEATGTDTFDVLADNTLKSNVTITNSVVTISDDLIELYANAGCSEMLLYFCFDGTAQPTPQTCISILD